jgi:hypothetical protein
MRFFRHVDKQGSPTLRETVANIVGGIALAMICLITANVWQRIPSLISFLFGSKSPLRQSIQVELWQWLLCVLVPCAIALWAIWKCRYNPVIHSAEYGANATLDDVRRKVQKAVNRGRRSIPAENELFGNGDPDYDPCRDVLKSLTIDYSIGGRRETKTVQEHGTLNVV